MIIVIVKIVPLQTTKGLKEVSGTSRVFATRRETGKAV